LFDLEGIGKSPSRLDFAKMDSVNAHFMKLADDDRLCRLVGDILIGRGNDVDAALANKIAVDMPFLKDRAKTLLELADACAFILVRGPLELGEKAQAQLTSEARQRVGRASDALSKLEDWSHTAIKDAIGAFATREGVGFGKVGPIMRAALTDNKSSLDLGMVMEILGRDESLARLCHVA
jgi:glutamyl-tRNA synthetase